MITFVLLTSVAAVASAQAEPGAGAQVSIGPTLGLLSEKVGYGGTLDVLARLSSDLPVYVGIESGLIHWESGGGNSTFSGTATHNSIPVLAAAIYRLELNDTIVQPYLGIAAGVSISLIGAQVSAGPFQATTSETNLYFEGLVKPGVQLGAFFLEPKFGIFDGKFIFLPTVGVTFGI